MYAQKIEGDQWLGEKLEEGVIEKMSGRCVDSQHLLAGTDVEVPDQQLGQLYELMQAIQKQSQEEEES